MTAIVSLVSTCLVTSGLMRSHVGGWYMFGTEQYKELESRFSLTCCQVNTSFPD